MNSFSRHQRLRRTPALRRIVAETVLSPSDFIMPIFLQEGLSESRPALSLPGVMHHNLESLKAEIDSIANLKIPAVLLFGTPERKDDTGSSAFAADGIVQQAISVIKKQCPDLVVIADCCLCAYTTHGHCGVLNFSGQLDNDRTLKILGKVAQSYAESGVDIVAPSGMMDGMIQAIRRQLDESGFPLVSVMSYAAKYASAFYGPFRQVAGSSSDGAIDRRHHQVAPTQRREVLRDALADEAQGADFLMVKPAGAYLDIIRDLRQRTLLPIVGYQVSGEYAMLKAAAKEGIVNEYAAFEESLLAIKRAGADLIISYYAKSFLSQ